MKNKKFWNWVNQASPGEDDSQERVLEINGTIAEESWFEDDVTPKLFADELYAGSGPVTIWLNSPGGDCIAASQIYAMLINKYTEELKQSVMSDDPYNLLYNQYYYHSQKWCEDNIELMIKRLEEDKYPRYTYTKMLIILVRLVSYGFKEEYLSRVKAAMISNVQNSPNAIKVDNDLFFIEDSELKAQIKAVIDEINQAIESSGETARRKNINEILQSNNWVDELDRFINPSDNRYVDDMAIFCQADSDEWCRVFREADSEQIDSFRHTLSELYPRNVTRKSAEKDLPVIKEILDKLKPEDESDLIKKACVGWLIYQFTEIVKSYITEE